MSKRAIRRPEGTIIVGENYDESKSLIEPEVVIKWTATVMLVVLMTTATLATVVWVGIETYHKVQKIV